MKPTGNGAWVAQFPCLVGGVDCEMHWTSISIYLRLTSGHTSVQSAPMPLTSLIPQALPSLQNDGPHGSCLSDTDHPRHTTDPSVSHIRPLFCSPYQAT